MLHARPPVRVGLGVVKPVGFQPMTVNVIVSVVFAIAGPALRSREGRLVLVEVDPDRSGSPGRACGLVKRALPAWQVW
jgi:hypothetical protein